MFFDFELLETKCTIVRLRRNVKRTAALKWPFFGKLKRECKQSKRLQIKREKNILKVFEQSSHCRLRPFTLKGSIMVRFTQENIKHKVFITTKKSGQI